MAKSRFDARLAREIQDAPDPTCDTCGSRLAYTGTELYCAECAFADERFYSGPARAFDRERFASD